MRYGGRLAERGAVPSIGCVGDSFENASAATVNGLSESELIRTSRPKSVEDGEDITTPHGRGSEPCLLNASSSPATWEEYLSDPVAPYQQSAATSKTSSHATR